LATHVNTPIGHIFSLLDDMCGWLDLIHESTLDQVVLLMVLRVPLVFTHGYMRAHFSGLVLHMVLRVPLVFSHGFA
jgi:hypothetical protein